MFRTDFSIPSTSAFLFVFPFEISLVLIVDNLRLTIVYAAPNILEILKTKVKPHMKEGKSPNSISFIYQPTFLDQANQCPNINFLSTSQNRETINAIKGA